MKPPEGMTVYVGKKAYKGEIPDALAKKLNLKEPPKEVKKSSVEVK